MPHAARDADSDICVVGDGSRTTERHYTSARSEGTCTNHAKSLSLAMATSPLSVTEPVPVDTVVPGNGDVSVERD